MAAVQNNPKSKQSEEFMRIQDLLYLCASNWYWFALSLMITLGAAFLYIKVTPPAYTRSASILIKEDSKGKSLSADAGSFADLGLIQANTNVNNEIISLQSPAIMTDVVKRLHLNMDYHVDGGFYREVLYGRTLPINVSIDTPDNNESSALTVKILADSTVELSDFIRNGEELPGKLVKGQLTDTIMTPVGKVTVCPTPYYTSQFSQPIYVSCSSLYSAVRRYAPNLSVVLNDEKSTVVDLSFKDVSIQRAEDILNTLIAVYNENWVKDKNQIAISTSMFINERLGVIEKELGSVDEDISSYKSEHLLPDVQAASSMYMAQVSETDAQLLALNNQLYMARYIRNYLGGESNKYQLLPANSGIENSNLGNQITEYNNKLLQRNSLVANSSDQNPLVIDLDHALAAMREAIIASIDNQVVTLNAQIKNLERSGQQTTTRIAESPAQAKYLLSVERQQKVKESLYLYLLQKREENELSQAFTAYNTRIITPAGGSMLPTAPLKKNILLVAFVAGLLIPVIVIFIAENMNTKVRGRKDLENMTIPFVGEIPLAYHQDKQGSIFRKKKLPETHTIVVKEKNRNLVNEAFRVVRTNLEFMLGKEGQSRVIMVTSANPGSGKTFITMNLAKSLAIKGKKILVIDLDMRKASLSSYVDSPRIGISNYLSGQVENFSEIIVKGKVYPGLDIIPVGTIPPNPTELLFDLRLEQMLSTLKTEYDCIFIDCPPVEIVADASIINKLSDMTLFIIRSGLLDRSMLYEIEGFYTDQRYKNMAVILNGTSEAYGHYGYQYGYRYGYNYGYGKGYSEEN